MTKKVTITRELDRRIHVLVSRQTDFGKTKLEFSVDETLDDQTDVALRIEALCEEMEEMADKRIAVYEGGPGEEIEPGEKIEPGEEIEPEEIEPEEIELSEEIVNGMGKDELVELCETTQGLENIDTKVKVKVLRVVIIDALFDDEEEGTESGAGDNTDTDGAGEGGDWQDNDWAD